MASRSSTFLNRQSGSGLPQSVPLVDRLGAAVHPKLVEDALLELFDQGQADVQPVGDVLVFESLVQAYQDILLPGGEPHLEVQSMGSAEGEAQGRQQLLPGRRTEAAPVGARLEGQPHRRPVQPSVGGEDDAQRGTAVAKLPDKPHAAKVRKRQCHHSDADLQTRHRF